MRIVGGAFRGRALATPRSNAIRPTTDRTREAVFNVLAHRFGGRLFMLGGLATVLIALVDPMPWLLLVVLVAVWLIAAGYSYYVHLRLEGSR